MPGHIKRFTDTSVLEFGQGRFDDWCVYLTRPNVARYAPKDVQYFARLQQLGENYTNQRIYNDYIEVYNRTNAQLNPAVMNFITEVTSDYGNDSLEMDILFTIIYAGMVAEENKARAILKKRIKRLGMYQSLIENTPAEYAATFSIGKGWRDLDAICRQRGF
jgi:hypothetical protein